MSQAFENTFGLSIKNDSLTAVELAHGKGQARVKNYSRKELEPEIVEDESIIVNPKAFQKALNSLLFEAKNGPIKSRNVIVSIPETKVFSHQLTIPKELMDNREVIMEEAKNYIPIELDKAVIDYKLLPNASSEKEVKYLFVATQKSIVESLTKELQEAGLNVVGIDIDTCAILRFCDNPFNRNEGDVMAVAINFDRLSLNISLKSGAFYSISSNQAGNDWIEKIKKGLNITTLAEAKKRFNELCYDKSAPQNPEYQKIQEILQPAFEALLSKANELIKIIEMQEPLNLKTIYFIGHYGHCPGLKEAFKTAYSEIELKEHVEILTINDETEIYYPAAIGLALRAILPEMYENDINLLPYTKKEELLSAKQTPVFIKIMILLAVVFGGLMIFSGYLTTKNYFNYQIAEREAKILQEKVNNPYLTQVAQMSQQERELRNQIIKILKDALPVSQVIQKIESYNEAGVSMINVNYNLSAKEIEMRLRAKSSTREATEQFILELENDPYFSDVISPLSNLVGRGERFVNMDLTLNPETIMAAFETTGTGPEETKKPSIPKTPNP